LLLYSCPKLWTKLKTLHAPTTLGDTRAFSSCYSQLLKSRFGDALPYLTWPVSHRAVMLALNVTMDMSPSVAVEVIELLAREKYFLLSSFIIISDENLD